MELMAANSLPRALAGHGGVGDGGNRTACGKAIATRLAAFGASVRNLADAISTPSNPRKRASNHWRSRSLAASDVTNSADVVSLVAQSESSLGAISILVNNAGIACSSRSRENRARMGHSNKHQRKEFVSRLGGRSFPA